MSSMLVEDRSARISRVATLALPKSFHRDHVGDRHSVYDDNGLSKDWSNIEPTTFVVTKRVEDLSRPKNLQKFKENPDRLSSVTTVSKAAQNTEPSARLEALAQPKQVPRTYQPAKAPYSVVSAGAKNAEPSARTEQLAQPKIPRDPGIKEGTDSYDWSEWKSSVSEGAKKAQASERTEFLATSKEPPSQYQPAKAPYWSCNSNVMNYSATERLGELAQARQHQSVHEEDPNAWRVSPAALKYSASERTSELAQPLPRKQRVKKG